jgi:hypothetical protein
VSSKTTDSCSAVYRFAMKKDNQDVICRKSRGDVLTIVRKSCVDRKDGALRVESRNGRERKACRIPEYIFRDFTEKQVIDK